MRFGISHILWAGLFCIDVGIYGLPTELFQRDLIQDVPINPNPLIQVPAFHYPNFERTIPDVHVEKRAGGKKKKKKTKARPPPVVTTPGDPSTAPTKPKDPSPKDDPKDDPKEDPKKDPKDDPKSPKDDPKGTPKDPNSPDSPKTPPDTPSPKKEIL